AGTLATIAATPICPSLHRLVLRARADIIHIHHPNPYAMLVHLTASPATPLVITYHRYRATACPWRGHSSADGRLVRPRERHSRDFANVSGVLAGPRTASPQDACGASRDSMGTVRGAERREGRIDSPPVPGTDRARR